MTDKDVRVRIQILDREKPIDFSVTTGNVLDVQRIAQSETHVSGGGGDRGTIIGDQVSINPVSISSRTESWTTDTIFLKYDGGEMSFKIRDNPVPVRAGNRLAVVYASWPREKTEQLLALYNYDTDRGRIVGTLPPPYEWIAIALIWGIPGLVGILEAVSDHVDFPANIFAAIVFAALFGTIPWFIYRAWARRKFNKRLQAIFNTIIDCLHQGKDLKTLEAT